MKRSVTHSVNPCPLGNRERYVTIGYVTAILPVVHLLRRYRPFAVTRLIVAVIVDAIYGVLCRWPMPDVRKEVFKRVLPPVTDHNASPSIARIGFMVWINEPFAYRKPRFMLWCASSSMSGLSDAGKLSGKTTTGFCCSIRECANRHNTFGRTLTDTKPFYRAIFSFSNRGYCSKAAKSIAGDIASVVGNVYNFIGHLATRYSHLIRWAGTPIPVHRFYQEGVPNAR